MINDTSFTKFFFFSFLFGKTGGDAQTIFWSQQTVSGCAQYDANRYIPLSH